MDQIIEIDFKDEHVTSIGDRIANLTLAQAAQLANYLEKVHGMKPFRNRFFVDVKKEVVVAEKTEFDVILTGYDPEKKIGVIKVFREISGLGLKEAKEWIETNVGKAIRGGLSKSEAENLKVKMESGGAKVSVE